MTQLLKSREELAAFVAQNPALGMVPTMGALHEGHLELVRRSRRENPTTLVSIFVNPTQFDQEDDLQAYPRTLDQDLELLAGDVACFAPPASELYPLGYRHSITSRAPWARELEGAERPGHFDGMLTIVLKLLLLARPARAYFGEKDYQQLRLVQEMAQDFFLPTEIVACPTVRESDGLALSSRNQRLSQSERSRAADFPRFLCQATDTAQARANLQAAGFEVDYVADWQGRRLGAVRLGSVRLIDNFATAAISGSATGGSVTSACGPKKENT